MILAIADKCKDLEELKAEIKKLLNEKYNKSECSPARAHSLKQFKGWSVALHRPTLLKQYITFMKGSQVL